MYVSPIPAFEYERPRILGNGELERRGRLRGFRPKGTTIGQSPFEQRGPDDLPKTAPFPGLERGQHPGESLQTSPIVARFETHSQRTVGVMLVAQSGSGLDQDFRGGPSGGRLGLRVCRDGQYDQPCVSLREMIRI